MPSLNFTRKSTSLSGRSSLRAHEPKTQSFSALCLLAIAYISSRFARISSNTHIFAMSTLYHICTLNCWQILNSNSPRVYRDFYARKRDLSASPRFHIDCFICADRLDLRCARHEYPRISQLQTLFPRFVFSDRIYKILAVCKCFWRFHNPDNPVNLVQKKCFRAACEAGAFVLARQRQTYRHMQYRGYRLCINISLHPDSRNVSRIIALSSRVNQAE